MSQTLCRLLLTVDPRDCPWVRFPDWISGRRGVLGWVTDAESADAGVPQAVAALLTRGLCRCFTLTFLRHPDRRLTPVSRWEPVRGGQRKYLKAGLFDRIRGNPPLTLLATSDPQIAADVFRTEGFDWDLGAQRVFLSPLGVAPDLDYGRVVATFDWPPGLNLAAHFRGTDVLGMMLPGADGDFAGLIVFDNGQWSSLQRALAEECAVRAVDFRIVDEGLFAQTRWVAAGP